MISIDIFLNKVLYFRHLYFNGSICLFGIVLIATQIIFPSLIEGAVESSQQKPVFEYIIENRADPFEPFITETAATSQVQGPQRPQVDPNEIIDEDKVLTGMQLFEPGQLKLVALIERGGENLAMVEDFSGKGYMLHEGIKIGRRGVVKDIGSNTVRIEETAVTRGGRKIVSEVTMTLRKEGEE